MTTDIASAYLVALSRWVDAGNANRDPEALTLHRVIKVTEEMGEAVAALIGALGANPRKGTVGTIENVLEELLDIAVSALGAYEHLDSHQGRALDELIGKIIRVTERSGALGTWQYGFSIGGPDDPHFYWFLHGAPFVLVEQAEAAAATYFPRGDATFWRRHSIDDAAAEQVTR